MSCAVAYMGFHLKGGEREFFLISATFVSHHSSAKRAKVHQWPKNSYGTFHTSHSQNATRHDISNIYHLYINLSLLSVGGACLNMALMCISNMQLSSSQALIR